MTGMNGSEPTIGNDGRAGGNLRTSLELTFSRRYSKYVMINITPNINACPAEDSAIGVKIESIVIRCFTALNTRHN